MKATWIDNNNASHPLRINVTTARALKDDCGIDLLACLVKTDHIQTILAKLAESPETLMAACATIEQVPAAGEPDYYSLWDGDAFESASVALLEAIADFFPQRPRQILTTLIAKMQQASQQVGDKAVKVATQQLENMDFTLALNESLTRGNGVHGSAASLVPIPTA